MRIGTSHFLLSCIVALAMFTTSHAQAQRDSIPKIVAGKFDWAKFKKEVNAPIFQQNDMAVYILRKDSLGDMIAEEESAAWIKDFHFIDVNGDRMLDAFYCGATKARGGYHTYFMLADSGLRYPIRLNVPGYVHLLTPAKAGLEFIIRDDARGKGYLHRISEYYFSYATKKADMGWQVQLVNTTEVPILHAPEYFELRRPTELRTTARMVSEPPMDYDQDGKPEAVGNVIGQLDAGQRLLRLAENSASGQDWSFVLVLSEPARGSVFVPTPGVRSAFGGWVLTSAVLGH